MLQSSHPNLGILPAKGKTVAKKLSANNWRTFADRRSYYRSNTVAIPATDMMPDLVILQLTNAPFRA